ncbi:MAG: DOPA 4,5-dioxygenase family protein [Candidatus Sericytochromatia bacterium]
MEFQAHIYYDQTCREQALKLQDALQHHFGHVARVDHLVDQKVGPHLWPSFEVAFHEDVYAPLTGFLESYHGPLPVLVHPVTADELANYSHLAEWIGQELPLDWSQL